ncbi:hypothetical protein, partial [uncultured Tateyamaria sp.]|uniref:hypothetical protein n=1 Tax=uncultured Tateyamaria sp. TaxID=455651 RepID=UPI0026095A18
RAKELRITVGEGLAEKTVGAMWGVHKHSPWDRVGGWFGWFPIGNGSNGKGCKATKRQFAAAILVRGENIWFF